MLACFIPPARAQTETGTIRASVIDPTGAVVPDATARLLDVDRETQSEVATGNTGLYTFAGIRPGHYRREVEKRGFRLVSLTGITVNVQNNLEQNFKLAVGSASEAITVVANAENLNTTNATVGTVVDNRFVESMPLNGRSFSTLIDLAPGVVLMPNNFFEEGQFSVNGQRPDANYFTVDGVSANLGIPVSSFGQGGAGQLPATNAFGGFSNLVSLDALHEFRIQTSTLAPEFGRTPGAPSDGDAQRRSRQRWPERRPESAVPDRRPALGATGAQVAILEIRRWLCGGQSLTIFNGVDAQIDSNNTTFDFKSSFSHRNFLRRPSYGS